MNKLGFKVYTSYTNLVLFFAYYNRFVTQAKENGALVMHCSNYDELGKGFYCVVVRNRWGERHVTVTNRKENVSKTVAI